jgi:hypothetical protein
MVKSFVQKTAEQQNRRPPPCAQSPATQKAKYQALASMSERMR